MNSSFQVITGSICGREHERTGSNCQDAFRVLSGEDWLVAIVADGCGSGRHSEVGAKLGTEIVSNLLAQLIAERRTDSFVELLESVRIRALEEISIIAKLFPGTLEEKVTDFFLFTLLGCVITDTRTAVFSLGDGIIAVNENIHILDYQNMPPYLLYGAFPLLVENACSTAAHFKLHADIETNDVQSIMLASDGFGAVYSLPEDDPRYSAGQELGNLWQHDRYFSNPARISRELRLLGKTRTSPDWKRQRLQSVAGIFNDDSTVVAIRRRENLLS